MKFNIGDYLFFGHFDSESNEIVIVRHKVVTVLENGLLSLDSGIQLRAIYDVDYSVDAALATGRYHADSYYNDMQEHYKMELAIIQQKLIDLQAKKSQITRTARV